MTDPENTTDINPLPLPEQAPMDDAAGGPQADDADDAASDDAAAEAPHTPVTD